MSGLLRVSRRTLCGDNGVTLVEVLIASVIVAIAAVGVALMFSTGQAFIDAEGDNRVSIFLAQQRVEQIRAQGAALPTGIAPTTETVTMTTPTGFPKQYTRTHMMGCVLPDDYSHLCEGATPNAGRLIIVCVIEGVFAAACEAPAAPSTVVTFSSAVSGQKQRSVVIYSVLSSRIS